jgi:prefoldin subunit 5
MGYETDFDAITYLERRVKYYKKKRASIRHCLKDEFFIKRYGRKKLKTIIAKTLEQIDNRIIEYKSAIETLS